MTYEPCAGCSDPDCQGNNIYCPRYAKFCADAAAEPEQEKEYILDGGEVREV